MSNEDEPPSTGEPGSPSPAGGSVPESQRRADAARTVAGPDVTPATAVYILYLVGLATGLAALIGVVIAHLNRQTAGGTWLESHYQFQIRTFWMGLAMLIVGIATSVLGIGLLIVLFFLVWATVRTVRGWSRLARHEPIADPQTFWW